MNVSVFATKRAADGGSDSAAKRNRTSSEDQAAASEAQLPETVTFVTSDGQACTIPRTLAFTMEAVATVLNGESPEAYSHFPLDNILHETFTELCSFLQKIQESKLQGKQEQVIKLSLAMQFTRCKDIIKLNRLLYAVNYLDAPKVLSNAMIQALCGLHLDQAMQKVLTQNIPEELLQEVNGALAKAAQRAVPVLQKAQQPGKNASVQQSMPVQREAEAAENRSGQTPSVQILAQNQTTIQYVSINQNEYENSPAKILPGGHFMCGFFSAYNGQRMLNQAYGRNDQPLLSSINNIESFNAWIRTNHKIITGFCGRVADLNGNEIDSLVSNTKSDFYDQHTTTLERETLDGSFIATDLGQQFVPADNQIIEVINQFRKSGESHLVILNTGGHWISVLIKKDGIEIADSLNVNRLDSELIARLVNLFRNEPILSSSNIQNLRNVYRSGSPVPPLPTAAPKSKSTALPTTRKTRSQTRSEREFLQQSSPQDSSQSASAPVPPASSVPSRDFQKEAAQKMVEQQRQFAEERQRKAERIACFLQAIVRGDLDLAKEFIARGIDVNVSNAAPEKATALHLAAAGGFEAIVLLLLNNGVDIAAQDGLGRTAREVASDPRIIKLLSGDEISQGGSPKSAQHSEQPSANQESADRSSSTPKKPYDEGSYQAARSGSKTLSGANLCYADLRGLNLEAVNLSNASLRGADLRGANLNGANLNGADLSDAILHNATFNKATLSNAKLIRIKAKNIKMEETILSQTQIIDADLEGIQITNVNMVDVEFINVFAKRAKIKGGGIRKSAEASIGMLKNVNFEGAYFENMTIEGTAGTALLNLDDRVPESMRSVLLNDIRFAEGRILLERINFAQAVFDDVRINRVNLKQNNFAGATIRKCKLTYSVIYASNFIRAVIANTKLSCMVIQKSDFSTEDTQFIETDFDEMLIDDSNFSSTDLSDMTLSKVDFGENSKFIKSQLENIKFDNCIIENVDFSSATFNNILFKNKSMIKNANFAHSIFKDVTFCQLEKMLDCNFSYATMVEVLFFRSILENLDMKNLKADGLFFNSTYLEDIDFSFAKLKNLCMKDPAMRHGFLGNTLFTTIFGNKLNFEYAIIQDSVFVGKKADMEDTEFRLRDHGFLQSMLFPINLANHVQYSMCGATYTFMTDCKFAYVRITNTFLGTLNITGSSGLDLLMDLNHTVFDAAFIGSSELEKILKLKGAKVNGEVADAYKTFWTHTKDPDNASLFESVLARAAGIGVQELTGYAMATLLF